MKRNRKNCGYPILDNQKRPLEDTEITISEQSLIRKRGKKVIEDLVPPSSIGSRSEARYTYLEVLVGENLTPLAKHKNSF